MEGSTGRQRVPDEMLRRDCSFPFPPPDEQAAIARILDAVDTALERTRAAVERARELDHVSLARPCSTKGLESDSEASRQASTALDRSGESMKWHEVGSGVTLGKDVSGFKSVELPYLRVANVQDGHLDLSTDQDGSRASRRGRELPPGGRRRADDRRRRHRQARTRHDLGGADSGLPASEPHLPSPSEPGAAGARVLLPWSSSRTSRKRYFNRVAKRTTNLASTNKTQVRAFRFPSRQTWRSSERSSNRHEGSKATIAALVAKADGSSPNSRSPSCTTSSPAGSA